MKSTLEIKQDISTIIYEDQINPAAMLYLGDWWGVGGSCDVFGSRDKKLCHGLRFLTIYNVNLSMSNERE